MLLTEFQDFWENFVRHVLHPKNAIIIVDVQNDFIDGSLALINCPAKQDGAEVVPVINELLDTVPFDVVAYTLDWHPKDHCSFIDNVHMRKISDKSAVKKDFKVFDTVRFEAFPDEDQKLWPVHCVKNTLGSELHANLKKVDEKNDEMKRKVIYCNKGNKSDIDSYSAFFDNAKLNKTSLDNDLKSNKITDIYVCGLAADVCVAATAYDGIGLKYRVVFIEDACRGIDLDSIEAKKKLLTENGAVVVSAKHVYNMIIGRDRRPELGYAILGLNP
jgi:nicotinamidase-related amidase